VEHVTRDPANSLGTVERRTCARRADSCLIFVKLGDGNAGIAFNISAGGLALSAANGFPDGRILELSIQLPDSGDWIRTAAEITWRGKSDKECGIRFVGMGEDARRRIQQWIAPATSSAGPTPAPESNGAFQNVQLESTAPTPGDAGVSLGKEHKDASNAALASESRGHSALQETQPETDSAATGATVFTKEKKDEHKVVAGRRMLTARVFPVNPSHAEAILDRRFYPRKRILPLGYVQLGDKNGGIALNVSEVGLSLIAANVLLEDNLPSIRLQFPGKSRWVDVKGEIVWRSESKKEAGVRFVDLPEGARLQLRNWLSSPARPLVVERQTELIRRREKNELPLTALSAPELLSLGPIPDSSPTDKAPEKASESFPPAVAEIFSEVSSLPAAHPRVESRASSQAVKRHPRVIRVRIKGGGGWKNAGVLFRAVTATVALLVLVGLRPLNREWLSSRPQRTKRMVEVVTPKQALGTKIAEAARQSPPANVATASQPQRSEAAPEPKGKPALPKNSAIAGMPTITLKDSLARGEGAQRPFAATVAKEPVRGVPELPRLNRGNTESSAAPVSVTNPTLAGEPSRVASAPPTPWPHQEAPLPAALIPVVSPPGNAEATESEKNSTNNGREGPSLPKSTEPAVRSNGTVAITTDPYPSIRFPGKPNGKKSRGETSLRLGQLLSRVEPAYPEEAMQKGVQGTVKIHVIVSPQGSIERLVSVDGPPLLVPATVRAVQQWRYSQTLLAGQPVGTEDNIAVTFGLSTVINR
jgi:TonB family protein